MSKYVQNRKTTVVTDSASYPITLADFKSFIKLSSSEDDDLISDIIIPAVTKNAEEYTRVSFIDRTVRQYQNSFDYDGVNSISIIDQLAYNSGSIEAPFIQLSYNLSPTDDSLISLKTYDTDGNATTIASSKYYTTSDNKIAFYNTTLSFGDIRERHGIEINYIAGFGEDATYVNPDIKMALLMHCQSVYDFNRANTEGITSPYEMPLSAKAILDKYKSYRLLNG